MPTVLIGIGYSHQLGHRGFTHSLVFAVLLAMLAAVLYRQLQATRGLAVYAMVAPSRTGGCER